tara:strand:- start:336 stop:1037 length:702 start_codon:yes stop_codon:yes gene_type:complete
MRPLSDNQVAKLFNEVSANYDLLNDVLSFGLHRYWKKKLLSLLNPSSGEMWIDLCCGTGDLSLLIARMIAPEGKVYAIDSAEKILLIAKKRAAKEPYLPITWLNEDVLSTTLSPKTFDGAIMAYGLRNLSDPFSGLKSIRRLLKKGARAGILDFASHQNGTINKWFQKIYLSKVVVPIASTLSLGEHYAYIEESLKFFPNGTSQKELAIEAGFVDADYHYLAGGQMGILLLKG